MGSEEEIEFLAPAAVAETDDVDIADLDYAMRSHMLLAVIHAAFRNTEQIDRDLQRWTVEAGRIDDSKRWIS